MVGNLTADLARRYGSPGAGGLVLVTETGTILQPWMSLEQGRVSHGERLTLRTVAAASAEASSQHRRPLPLFGRLQFGNSVIWTSKTRRRYRHSP